MILAPLTPHTLAYRTHSHLAHSQVLNDVVEHINGNAKPTQIRQEEPEETLSRLLAALRVFRYDGHPSSQRLLSLQTPSQDDPITARFTRFKQRVCTHRQGTHHGCTAPTDIESQACSYKLSPHRLTSPASAIICCTSNDPHSHLL